MIAVLYLWKIPTSAIPFALARMALDRLSLRKNKDISFSKSLGCGKGTNFTPFDADMNRWGILVCLPDEKVDDFDASLIIKRWQKHASREFRLLLDPISSHGQWSRKLPFEFQNVTRESTSEIAAITRARISLPHIIRFWRSIPPVARSLHGSQGLIHSLGIGEAPIGLQGTFSLWESAEALREFAYKGEAHQRAIADTGRFKWYSEELFARFSVREKRGSF